MKNGSAVIITAIVSVLLIAGNFASIVNATGTYYYNYEQPPIVRIYANPQSIPYGGSTVLTWTSTNVTTCSAAGGWAGSKAPNGSQTVTPSVTTNFIIICNNSRFQTSDSVIVEVRPQNPPTVTLTANPTNITSGDTSILTWTSTNADYCVTSGDWSGEVPRSGTRTVSPTTYAEYTIICANSGRQVSAHTTINVSPAPPAPIPTPTFPTVHITATPMSLAPGNSSILQWTSANATQCSATGDWSGTKALSGTQTVQPSVTQTYVIICSNSFAQVSDSVIVTARSDGVPTVSVVANPEIINQGGSSILTWTSGNARDCTASGGWSGSISLSGSQNVTPSISTTYTITCSSGSGQSTAQTTIYVNNQQLLAPAVNLNALPNTISRGQTSLLVWSSTNATQCYASGGPAAGGGAGWSGAKALSGSETVSPTVNTAYSLNCSNSSGQAADTDTVFVNNILFEPPTRTQPFTAACVISPSITQVNRMITAAAGQSGGSAPYSYSWSGDISGTGVTRNFIFSTTGAKTIRLTVTDATGKTAEATCQTRVNSAVIATPTPTTPTVITTSTPPPSQCNCPTAQVIQAPVCRTYTTCSDGQTYEIGGSGNGRAQTTPTNPSNFIYDSGVSSGQITPADQGQLPQTQVAGQEQTGNGSLLASLFTSKEGVPSRFTFLIVWYILILFFVGFLALIYSAVLKRA